MPSRDRHARLAELFDAALAIPAAQREAFLQSQCDRDSALLDELQQLLQHHSGESDNALKDPLLGRPVSIGAVINAAAGSVEHDPAPSIDIPGYRLVHVLGEGGMGVVYLAEQDKPRRQVAIKLMRPGAASPALLKRFDLEQELLGRLQHPGIAQIFGTGVCKPFGERGPTQPYFVMEYVQGLPITDYCAQNALGARDRLRLLLAVCEAVQHAHSRGIVHRDLKPGNILVASRDGETERRRDGVNDPHTSSLRLSVSSSLPHTKILDFGVARATDSDIQVTTLHTGVGQLIGTLAYMSPEQAEGDPARIDARSDVYALGVIGYELLAGRLPLEIRGKSVADAARAIRDEDPRPLSLADRVFRGDLDTIFAKALEKEPDQRYAGVADLAADIQRFLDDQPIVARPASTIYNLRKFARRNKGLVAGIALAFAVLVAGVVATSVMLFKARAAEKQARRETARVTAVRDFMSNLFASPHPTRGGKDVKVVDVLANWESEVRRGINESPDILGEIHFQLAAVHAALSQYDKAGPLLDRCIELRRGFYGPDHLETLHAEGMRILLLRMSGDIQASERDGMPLLERCRTVLGPAHIETLWLAGEMGLTLKDLGKVEEAERLYRESLALWPTGADGMPQEPEKAATLMNDLALVLRERDGNKEAETLYRRAIELDELELGRGNFTTLKTINNLAVLLRAEDRLDEAEPLFREVLDARVKMLGEDHQDTLLSMNNLAMLLLSRGKRDDAEPVLRQTHESHQRALGPGNNGSQIVANNYAHLLLDLDRAAEAAPIFTANLEAARISFPAGHWRIGLYQAGVGESVAALGRVDEGMSMLRESLAILTAAVGADDQRTKRVAAVIAEIEARAVTSPASQPD